MKDDQILRKEVLALLRGGQAHMGLKAVEDFPANHYNTRPPNVEYTFWHLLEHIRRAQKDILDFMQSPDYQSLNWPDDYWPAHNALCTPAQWVATVQAIRDDLAAVEAIVESEDIDLRSELPYAPGYTYLREVLLVADHNAYHLGEFAILRQVCELW